MFPPHAVDRNIWNHVGLIDFSIVSFVATGAWKNSIEEWTAEDWNEDVSLCYGEGQDASLWSSFEDSKAFC